MLSCDANSAYRMRDTDHLLSFDEFEMLMIEQPLWADDFYFHSMLQKQLETSVCLDESIRNRRDALAAIDMESCRIINIKLGRVGGFSEAIAVHNAAHERGIPCGAAGCSKRNRPVAQYRVVIAGKFQSARQMSPPPPATGRKILSSPQ